MTVSRLTIDDGGAPTQPDSRKPGPEEAIAATQPQNWQARLAEVEQKAQARMDERKVDALEVAHEQHLKALRLVLGKGLEALRGMSIESPRDAIRAIGLAVRETGPLAHETAVVPRKC